MAEVEQERDFSLDSRLDLFGPRPLQPLAML